MAPLTRLGAVLLLCLYVGFATAQETSIDAPRVFLTGVSATVSVTDVPESGAVLRFNDVEIAELQGGFNSVEVLAANGDAGTLVVVSDAQILAEHSAPVIPGWVSVLPPLIAILLSFILRSVVPSLFAGLIIGAWAINGLTAEGAVVGVFETMTVYVLGAMVDPDHGAIMLFSLLIGGMVGIISRNGGMIGVVNMVIPVARTPKRGQAVIASLGLAMPKYWLSTRLP